ncbi:MAG: TonB-dependent receptor plug domain-containing protein [Salinivirgaceae bacterium]|nr:TonB-dependent receptor plug domain-containing protein [Salinivirgaceae bacterium]
MNMFRKLSVTLSVMLLACSTFAQKGVTGMVKDHNGAPLVGANIYVKGTTVSTITGPTGEFNINASDSNAVLLITYNGYQNMEVPVRDLATANMQMKLAASTEEFDSFYGNDRYYTLTTARTIITTDDIATGLETDVYQFLLGRVPGFEIVSDGGNPWGNAEYRLRGGYSAIGDNDSPLFVVDGAYFSGNEVLNMLNPNDIESIMVLKDAPATASYGDLGCNGVVVIKTRNKVSKTLRVSYDGNGSYNTCDEDTAVYKNSISTKHNASVEGIVGPLPYRAAIGYNAINGVMRETSSDRISASFWVGPSLLDDHLKIDFNGYFRKKNNENVSDEFFFERHGNSAKPNNTNFMGTLKTDYAVHSFEDLHLNILASYAKTKSESEKNTDVFEGNFEERKYIENNGRFMFDANISLNHEFDKKHYLELKAGATLFNTKREVENKWSTGHYELDKYRVVDNSEHVITKETLKRNSFYGQFNVALNRFYLNLNSRFNKYPYHFTDSTDYKNLSVALSLGVKAGNAVVIRTGFGMLGISLGDTHDEVNSFNTLSYNFGIDAGTSKNRVYGTFDFYVHHHLDLSDYNLTNVGVELSLGAKLINTSNVKWRIGGNISANAGILSNVEIDENLLESDVSIDRPMAYTTFEEVYDDEGNPIKGAYLNYNDVDNNTYLDEGDRKPTDLSPIPVALAGFNTYFEAMKVYLQVDTHASLGRFNVVGVDNWYYSTSDIHNSSFFRIDDIVLGYKFQNLWKLSGRVYTAVQNPVVFTNYEGNEPEISDGFDNDNVYQRPTIFSVGVKLNINLKD